MRNKLFLACIAILISAAASAQNQNKFEIGAGYAPFFLMHLDGGLNFTQKYDAYFEWRHDLGTHFDVGARLDYKVCPMTAYNNGTTLYKGTLHCPALLAVADFNFLPGKKVNPFVGVGTGPALTICGWASKKTLGESGTSQSPIGKDFGFAWVASPRVGVELFEHLRLAASVDLAFSAEIRNPVCFSIGWVF